MRNRRGVILGILTAVLTVAVTAQTDVTGDWNLTFNLDTGATAATMTVEQDGEKFMGTFNSDQGTFEFEGKLDRSGQIVSGTLKDSSGAARAEGQVIGAFYGPYAAELNLFGKLVLADGRQLLVFFFQQP